MRGIMFSTKRLVLLVTLYGVIVAIESKKFRSDYTYHPSVDGWLKYHNVPGTWHDARERCYLEGAVLASPFNESMESALRSEMNRSSAECEGIYVGVHSIFSKGYFYSLEGLPLSKMPVQWMPGEPDNAGNNEDCIAFANRGGVADVNRGGVADVDCSEVLPFVCYKKSAGLMSVMPCGTTDIEYEYVAKTGSCYKLHTSGRTWPDAYKICSAEGGYLAVINSKEEASLIKTLYNKQYQHDNSVISIGFHDWNKDGVWRTVHGQTLKEAGYAEWADKQPDGPGQYCGAMFTDTKLDNFWCDRATRFLCEKNPDNLQD